MPIRLPAICDYHQTRRPLEKGAAKGRDRRKRQLSDFFVADMGDCSKYRILQMAVIRDDDFLTPAFISLWGSCASSRHSILRLWRGPSPRAYSRGIISHRLSYLCDKLCLFEALYPTPLARPFSKGLFAGIISHGLSFRCGELCLFEALHPAPLARPFSKGLCEEVMLLS